MLRDAAPQTTHMLITAYYEDTDASGVVYHANYLRWFERARTEWLRNLGVSQNKLTLDHGIAFTLASISVRYRKPCRLDDKVRIETEVVKVGRASLEFMQYAQLDSDGTALADAHAKVGCVSVESFRPKAMPASLITKFDWEPVNE